MYKISDFEDMVNTLNHFEYVMSHKSTFKDSLIYLYEKEKEIEITKREDGTYSNLDMERSDKIESAYYALTGGEIKGSNLSWNTANSDRKQAIDDSLKYYYDSLYKLEDEEKREQIRDVYKRRTGEDIDKNRVLLSLGAGKLYSIDEDGKETFVCNTIDQNTKETK